MAGDCPDLRDGLPLTTLTTGIGLVLVVLGFVPLVGQTLVPVAGACVTGFFLSVELTSIALERRGLGLTDGLALLWRRRLLALGFGLAAFVLFLVPLGAVRAVHLEHGRLPRRHEWEHATPTRPRARTIERRWGWRELLAEAIGTQRNQVDVSWETLLDARVQAMLAALAAAGGEIGRWPSAREWDRGGRQPSARTFVRHLGGWAEACRAAERSTIAAGPELVLHHGISN